MCGDRSVLLCVVCFVGGLVIGCVVSVVLYGCETLVVDMAGGKEAEGV